MNAIFNAQDTIALLLTTQFVQRFEISLFSAEGRVLEVAAVLEAAVAKDD